MPVAASMRSRGELELKFTRETSFRSPNVAKRASNFPASQPPLLSPGAEGLEPGFKVPALSVFHRVCWFENLLLFSIKAEDRRKCTYKLRAEA